VNQLKNSAIQPVADVREVNPIADIALMKRLLSRTLYIVGGVAGLLLIFALLIRATILPPLEVIEYQLAMSPRPIIGGHSLNINGWGWYPIRIEQEAGKQGKSVTFVQFLPFVDPSKRPITFFAREDITDDHFFITERQYPWGRAKLIKPDMFAEQTSFFAWLPDHHIYVAANTESALIETLPIIDLFKN